MPRFFDSKRNRLILSILLVLFFTLIVSETLSFRHSGSRGLSLIPFTELYKMFKTPDHLFYFKQITLNIILFIPFGFTLTSVLHEKEENHLRPVLIAGALLSVSVEVLQYLTSRGYTEIDDVINNTLGAVIGWWGYNQVLKMRG